MLDRKKHKQEVEALKADNRQKDMNRRTSERRGQAKEQREQYQARLNTAESRLSSRNSNGLDYPEREGGKAKLNLSKDYVTEWRTYIAEPLAIAFLLRASAIRKRAFMAFGLASVLLSLTTSCAVHRTATESSRFKVQEFKV